MPRGRGRGRGRGCPCGCTLGSERMMPLSVEGLKEAGTQSSAVARTRQRRTGKSQEKEVDWNLKKHETKNKQVVSKKHAEEKASPSEEAVSYASRSPLRPDIPCINKRPQMVALDTYLKECEKYKEALAREEQFAALGLGLSGSCTLSPQLSPNPSSIKKCTMLSAAKFVLGLSSFLDGTQISQCSGILIDFNRERRSSTILTSAHLFCTKQCFDEWSTDNKYAPAAKIHVQMLDKTCKGPSTLLSGALWSGIP